MRFFAVWVYLTWCNSLSSLAAIWRKVTRLRNRVALQVIRRIDYRLLLGVAYLRGLIPLGQRALRGRAAVARANKDALIGPQGKVDVVSQTSRRQVLELAATYGQNPRVLAQLAACTGQLDEVVTALHAAGSPVVLAPMHMVSDILAGIVGAGVYPGKATVIVSSSVEVYQEQARRQGGVSLDYCSIHDDNREIAVNLTDAIMEAADHQRNIIIFPDITPDFTINTNKSKTAKMHCTLFDRSANLHSGVIRIARALSAQVVFYYLYYDNGIKINIFSPVAASQLRQELPKIIEASLRQQPEDWLLWHAHSLFFINE
jgi:lauroyl/myristoyl acyltransferase